MAAQANIAAHFSQRPVVHAFPEKVGTVDTVVLWLDTPTRNLTPHNPGMIGTTAHHLQMWPAEYLAEVECLLDKHDFGVILWEDPWLVLSRGAAGLGDRPVREKLLLLRTAWKVPDKDYAAALRACR